MRIGDILDEKGGDVFTLSESALVADAVDVLGENNIGVVVITGADGGVVGILSERDIVRRLREHGAAAIETGLSKCMTRDPFTCSRDVGLDEVMGTMSKRRIRHMPVVESGKLLGLVSIGDIVKRKIEQTEREAAALRDYIAS
ncbi:CBS domain-containing protein [Maritalea myrionectae]|uniref:Arabinose-5-phosphate isomerase n=1 Tax=Maritalea myrionectae TaxID=454601 RepID=A0A2R4MAY5_9HYPH|nr:CBS domain-containing protein [Maritalea myrionectae]AVX03172.1 arabinose-5-phosphate isomerase [Maritalea myrionectae]